MNRNLKTKVDQFNKIKFNKDNSKRIIIGTLRVNSGDKWTVTTAPKTK